MLEFLRRQYEQLLTQRAARKSEAEAIIAAADAEKRSTLTPAEQAAFDQAYAGIRDLDTQAEQMRTRIAEVEEDERRAALVAGSRADQAAAAGQAGGTGSTQHVRQTGGGVVTDEPRTYREKDRSGRSWARDMFDVAVGNGNAPEARDRLIRNTREIEVDLRTGNVSEIEQRALSTGAGAGGDFAPPAWLVSQFIALARAARPTADRVMNQPLPMGIASVNVPKLLTGTAAAQQASQNTAVQNTDATTSAVTAAITTIAGQQVLSQQLIDQAGVNLDDILLADLTADYNAKVDLFVLNNNATNAKGLLQQAGTLAITYTSATPNIKLLFAMIANAIQSVQSSRFLPPDTVIMAPRRWGAIIGASDTQNRPIVGVGGTNMNAPAVVDRSYAAQGVVGQIAGLDVVVDPQIPVNLGAGTNQDAIIVTRASDQILWEGDLKAEAFRETKADQLSVLLRVYNYAAFTAGRYAPSTAVINGTGLVTPAFDGS